MRYGKTCFSSVNAYGIGSDQQNSVLTADEEHMVEEVP